MTDRTAFETCTEITWLDGRTVRTERVAGRVDPGPGAWNLKALRTTSGARVDWNDVAAYTLPR